MSAVAVSPRGVELAERVKAEAKAKREANLRNEPFVGSFDVAPARPAPEPPQPAPMREDTIEAPQVKPRSVRDLEAQIARETERYTWALKFGTPAEAKARLRVRGGLESDLELAIQLQRDREAYAASPEFAATQKAALAEAKHKADAEAADAKEIARVAEVLGQALIALDLACDGAWMNEPQRSLGDRWAVPKWLVRSGADVQQRAMFAAIKQFVDNRLPGDAKASSQFLATRLSELARYAMSVY